MKSHYKTLEYLHPVYKRDRQTRFLMAAMCSDALAKLPSYIKIDY